MQASTRWIRRGLLAAVFAAASGAPGHAQDHLKSALVGSWLIEPAHYDAWVETGFDAPWYPFLDLRNDGTFALFRLAPHCQPLGDDGAEVDFSEDTPRRGALCADARAVAANHDILAAHLHASASGRWRIEAGGRVRFEIEKRGVGIAYHLRGAAAELRRKLAMGDSGLDAAGREAQRALARFLDIYEKRMPTFYSTLYVFDGEPAAAAVARGRLELGGPNRGEAIVFRAVRPALVDSAMGLLLLLNASAARYFRCAVAKLAPDFPAIGQPHAGLPALAAQARELVARGHKRRYANTLHKAGREIDAVTRWSASDERNYVADFAYFHDHPAAKASRAQRLGAFLGCPERDRR